MNRVTIAELEGLVQQINRLTGHGNGEKNVGRYQLGGAYSGWRLERIVTDGGAIYTPLGGGYYSKPELAGKLRAFIHGLQTAQEQKAAK